MPVLASVGQSALHFLWCHSAGCCEATGVGVVGAVGAVGTALLCSALLCFAVEQTG